MAPTTSTTTATPTTAPTKKTWWITTTLVLIAAVALAIWLGYRIGRQINANTPAPAEAAPAIVAIAVEPTSTSVLVTPTTTPTTTVLVTTDEVRHRHINPGASKLDPGESINGGHIVVEGVDYQFVDDKLIVVTNNSGRPLSFSSTDGVGWTNSVDPASVVNIRFTQGCDANGCSKVLWIDWTTCGPKVYIVTPGDDPKLVTSW